MSNKTPHNCRWVIATVNKPVLSRRSDDETWILNPKRRYVLNADQLAALGDTVDSISDLQGSAHYRPLIAAHRVRLPKSSILIERYRDRGIGDFLFTTGPLAYLHHVTGNNIFPYFYAHAERGAVLNNNPYLAHRNPLVGPIMQSDLQEHSYHWFIDTVTEYNEEPDQPNVYDSLYQSLGIDPATVPAKFKRPNAELLPQEIEHMDTFFHWVYTNTKPSIDLRKSGYYVVAPFSNSHLRTARYEMWLQAIELLAVKRPVLVVGAVRERMPASDMTAGQFMELLDNSPNLVPSGRVINLIGRTQVRNVMQYVSKANCVVSMDSGTLYIAQAFRTPCVSLWGSHHPGVRIGYDQEYLDLAIWNKHVCASSPCYAYAGFPATKCPEKDQQRICSVIQYASGEEIAHYVDRAEQNSPSKLVL